MAEQTKQEGFWDGEFGQEYTDRNSRTPAEWDEFYVNQWGLTKTKMNEDFLGSLPRDIKILEVGCNTCMQLVGLQEMGFTNLYGVELQWYAVNKAREYTKNINIVQGSGFDIPFKDGFFDLVCTNGVLIHIAPENLPKIMSEMVRCSKQYIWGFEYYADQIQAVDYRGNENYLWKGDYAAEFQKIAPDLKLAKHQKYPYVQNDNVDAMYLLEK